MKLITYSLKIKNERKGKIEFYYMQGVLPNYTKLGMESLLPNKTIEINDKYDVIVNGINSNGTDNRNTILKMENEKSLAITYDTVMDMKDAEIRKAFTGLELVYIYHNTIDARGDHASTEREVLKATSDAFKEILLLVNKLVNRVSAANIIITEDHGYLYKRSAIEESNKISGIKRTYRVKFVLESRAYDKTKQYFLVMEDAEDANGDYERIPFNINIAIVDDFGF